MFYLIYILAGIAGGILTGMAGLTAAMVLTPILCDACGWAGYDAVTMSLIANVLSALVTSYTYYKNGNMDIKRGIPVALASFGGAVVGSWLGYLFSSSILRSKCSAGTRLSVSTISKIPRSIFPRSSIFYHP